MKKLIKGLAALSFAVMISMVMSDSGAAAVRIGVSMPTQSLQRWNQDGANMKAELEKAGYEVELLYAGDNDIPSQINQIENMIGNGDAVLVIAAVDGSSLNRVLGVAKEKNIPVISYDRLIMDTDAVSYYATFDNYKVGQMQGRFLVEALKLDQPGDAVNMEFFTGSADDNNVNFFWGGAIDVLKPYIDSKRINVRSAEVTKDQCAIANWNTEAAQERMESLISANGYGPDGTRLDAVLSSNDSVAVGIVNALVSKGYTDKDIPIVTGQDCDRQAVKNMKHGLQSMSIFKDTRILASQVVKMVDAIVSKKEVPVNDTRTYNNGTGVIPAFLCEPVIVTRDNLKEVLVDSGYYKESEIY